MKWSKKSGKNYTEICYRFCWLQVGFCVSFSPLSVCVHVQNQIQYSFVNIRLTFVTHFFFLLPSCSILSSHHHFFVNCILRVFIFDWKSLFYCCTILLLMLRMWKLRFKYHIDQYRFHFIIECIIIIKQILFFFFLFFSFIMIIIYLFICFPLYLFLFFIFPSRWLFLLIHCPDSFFLIRLLCAALGPQCVINAIVVVVVVLCVFGSFNFLDFIYVYIHLGGRCLVYSQKNAFHTLKQNEEKKSQLVIILYFIATYGILFTSPFRLWSSTQYSALFLPFFFFMSILNSSSTNCILLFSFCRFDFIHFTLRIN